MNWEPYYKATENKEPNELFLYALSYARPEGNALDFGAGALRDSKYLLSKKYRVIAVDSSPLLLQIPFKHPNLFRYNKVPKDSFDLISSQWCLSFIPSSKFNKKFFSIIKLLKKDGIFVGQFLGKNDGWNSYKTMSFFSKKQIQSLLKQNDLRSILCIERKETRESAVGEMKNWHYFDVIAMKK